LPLFYIAIVVIDTGPRLDGAFIQRFFQFQWGQVAMHSKNTDVTQEAAVSGESRVPTAGSQVDPLPQSCLLCPAVQITYSFILHFFPFSSLIVQQRGEFSETMSPQGQKIERLSFEN
jgi:hypothetical protein